METIKEVKEYLRENVDKGVRCPCCNQFVKVYKRGINSTMARILIQFYHKGGHNEFKHIPTIMPNVNSGDFAKLRYWNLIEEMPNTNEAKRTSGFWKITDSGVAFVEGRLTVAKKAHIYNQKLLRLDDSEKVSIQQTLGKHFNYQELMRA